MIQEVLIISGVPRGWLGMDTFPSWRTREAGIFYTLCPIFVTSPFPISVQTIHNPFSIKAFNVGYRVSSWAFTRPAVQNYPVQPTRKTMDDQPNVAEILGVKNRKKYETICLTKSSVVANLWSHSVYPRVTSMDWVMRTPVAWKAVISGKYHTADHESMSKRLKTSRRRETWWLAIPTS